MRPLVVSVVLLSCCSREHTTPSIRPLPAPDERGALHKPIAHSPRIANYQIEATYDPSSHRITATQRLRWINPSRRAVTRLPFHLYINAFSGPNTTFMRELGGHHRSRTAPNRNWGGIQLSSVRVDDGPESVGTIVATAEDQTVVELPLQQPVLPGQSVQVAMTFEVQLPEAVARTGWVGEFTMVGQWFPKLGVLVGDPGQERWHCEPFHANSEFFADFGSYDVAVTVPDTHVVAATGVLTDAHSNNDGTRTLRYRAQDVHDFAWMADPYMKTLTGTAVTSAGPVEVRVYYRPDQQAFATRHLRAGIGAIEKFSERLVPYPYTLLTIIDPPPAAASSAGGMEYPTLVTTSGDHALFGPGVRLAETVTVHEVGHQWFQGLLATNEVEEAWLDEGLNEYFDGVVLAELYGHPTTIATSMFHADYYDLTRARTNLTGHAQSIRTVSYEFTDAGSYADASYGTPALALKTLENLVGADEFLAAMKQYATRYAFAHPTGDQFFATLNQELDRDLDWFIEPIFSGTGSVQFRAESIDCTATECVVTVSNTGDVAVPATIEVWFTDDHVERVLWNDGTFAKSLQFPRAVYAEVAQVNLDPEGRVAINATAHHCSLRRRPDRAAARRAGAHAQFWTQALMQVTGL